MGLAHEDDGNSSKEERDHGPMTQSVWFCLKPPICVSKPTRPAWVCHRCLLAVVQPHRVWCTILKLITVRPPFWEVPIYPELRCDDAREGRMSSIGFHEELLSGMPFAGHSSPIRESTSIRVACNVLAIAHMLALDGKSKERLQ
ncbi:unnamed protein product [Lupinus luteus]|uniref:Uncharacterized protein n=1 Tax=Lupinus luteus TaxID=3873 RepID=A0AAV1VRN2_LUPLU